MARLAGLAGLVLGVTASLGATAQADSGSSFTANVGVTSDYRFRGQSQTQTEPAVFGGIDYVGESGIFAGVWASNVDFNDAAETYLEVDVYAGYTFPIGTKTTGTVKVAYYAYPLADYPAGAKQNDYLELIAAIGHDFGGVTAGAEFAWSPDFFLESGESAELAGSLSVPLADTFLFFDGGLSASGRVGYQWIDDNANFGTPDYAFFDIGLVAKVDRLTFDLRYVDTDLNTADCFGGTNLCDGGIVGTITVALP
jgi:uncharacterized protein (TIGR02001 family)